MSEKIKHTIRLLHDIATVMRSPQTVALLRPSAKPVDGCDYLSGIRGEAAAML
ncbi:hypothetical protein [Cupriavidus alkaliphilus]|uniref:Uncharacterized protein n=1 Tax=Cupriavidus alkaliphilus TaxID=942866 RepID=A0A7W4VCV8_9BURK|nr:hypothetical protein [Cupriavidus alkaliphilus]MBB3009272.1 hypothetical protein [Cupriavidus alkaliphilus]